MPSTTLGDPSPSPAAVAPPIGYWRREASHFPQPLSPMSRALLRVFSDAFADIFANTGAFLDGLEFREIGGWVYTRQVPFGGKDRKAPPPWVLKLLVRTLPAMRARLKKNLRAIREDITWSEIQLWLTEWKADQQRQLASFRAVDLQGLSDEAFVAHYRAVEAFFHESFVRHFRLAAPGLVVAELAFACEELLGWDTARAFSLLTGLSNTSTEPGTKLAALAAMASTNPGLQALLRSPNAATPQALRSMDPAFADKFDAYQDTYAYRALRYDVCDRTLLELPQLTLGLIRDQIDRRFDPASEADAAQKRRSDALAEARAALAGLSALERERFERAVERAQTYYPIREENEFHTVSAPTALMRFVLLELGSRMAARGQFSERDDIFMLEAEEALPAFASASDCHALVARRRSERAWAAAHPAPPSYGRDPGLPPDFSVFPKEAADGMKAIFWSLERVFENDRSQQQQRSATALKGIAAAPGQYRGPARIILTEEEFDKIQPGDVLVCPITSPVWSVLFPSVGALVTDTGGILSHPAIIAREYGIPAVVATGNATALLSDGQLVMVDGDGGTVTAL